MSLTSEIEKRIKSDDYEGLLLFLEDKIKQEPFNEDLKIRLALLLQSVFIGDYYAALHIIENDLLKTNPLNIKAIILKAYIEDTFQGEIGDDTIKIINNYINNSMLQEQFSEQAFIIRAFYYRNKNTEKYFSSLLDSITHDRKASFNHYLLSEAYLEKRQKTEASQNLEIAISNIHHVYKDEEYVDLTDFTEFINEKIRGTAITQTNYESMVCKRL